MDRRERWEKVRSKGLLRFVLEIGILRFALPVTLVMKAIDCFYTYFFTERDVFTLFTARQFKYALIGMLFEGVFFGVFLWIYGEYKFRKLMP